MKRIHFSEFIRASRQKVWETMLADSTYRDWTSAFAEGSYYEGSWEQGKEIRFSSPEGGGMVATIAVNRPHEHLSIKHIGVITKEGAIDTESESVKKWAPAFENYRLIEKDGGTEVQIEMDSTADFECFMNDTWPKALTRLKVIAES